MTTAQAGVRVRTMLLAAARRRNSFTAATSRYDRSSARLLVLFALLRTPTPAAATDEVVCRTVRSGYVSGDPVPDTCTVQLTLNDTETEMIDSLKDKFQDFPLKCRLRK